MDNDALALLLTHAGWSLLESLPPYEESTSLALGQQLRDQGMEPLLVAAALTQSRLRAKAAAKFGEFAHGMLFTPHGLEQATRLPVAALHAQRFLQAEATCVADLGCGIGGDALALAGSGLQVIAVEHDELTAAIATVNLRQFPEARVVHGDALAVDLTGADAIWADPARRTKEGRRLSDLGSYSPSVSALLALRERMPRLGMKLGPGLRHCDVPSDAHAQWLSVDGEVLEADLWFDALAPEGPGRSARVIRDGTSVTVAGPTDPRARVEQAPSGPLAEFLHEPDGAVIRAGLVATLARDLSGVLIDPSIAYVTTQAPSPSPAATSFRVLDHFPFSLKRLRGWLRERDVGRVEIKKRGTAVDPADLRKRLQLRGSEHASVILTRIAGQQHVIAVERLTSRPPG